MALLSTTRNLLLALGLVALVLPAQAQWKWRDARGQVHVSDLPPPREVPDKDVLQRPGAPGVKAAPGNATGTTSGTASSNAPAPAPAASASPALPAKTAADPELEARKKRVEADAAAKGRADEAKLATQRAENCKNARSNLSTLESGQRIARNNEKGEREFVDDKTRADEIRRAREVITADCRAGV